jgi:hypothetical protein
MHVLADPRCWVQTHIYPYNVISIFVSQWYRGGDNAEPRWLTVKTRYNDMIFGPNNNDLARYRCTKD